MKLIVANIFADKLIFPKITDTSLKVTIIGIADEIHINIQSNDISSNPDENIYKNYTFYLNKSEIYLNFKNVEHIYDFKVFMEEDFKHTPTFYNVETFQGTISCHNNLSLYHCEFSHLELKEVKNIELTNSNITNLNGETLKSLQANYCEIDTFDFKMVKFIYFSSTNIWETFYTQFDTIQCGNVKEETKDKVMYTSDVRFGQYFKIEVNMVQGEYRGYLSIIEYTDVIIQYFLLNSI